MIDAVLLTAGVYLAIGVLVASVFVTLGVGRIDGAASHSGALFRLLILPGCAGAWPWVLARWVRAPRRRDAPEGADA